MAARKNKAEDRGPSLFDVLDVANVAEEGAAACEHRSEAKTETVWPGERKARLTMTCAACKRVRGRYPGE
jgi:hypothetical protein